VLTFRVFFVQALLKYGVDSGDLTRHVILHQEFLWNVSHPPHQPRHHHHDYREKGCSAVLCIDTIAPSSSPPPTSALMMMMTKG
jgi:hypothetical protein